MLLKMEFNYSFIQDSKFSYINNYIVKKHLLLIMRIFLLLPKVDINEILSTF